MGLIALKCPNCSGDIELDADREFGFCMYCGSKVMIEKTKIDVRDHISDKKSSLKQLIETHIKSGEYKSAEMCLCELFEIDKTDPDAILWEIEILYEQNASNILPLIPKIEEEYSKYRSFSGDTRSLTEIISSFGYPKPDIQKQMTAAATANKIGLCNVIIRPISTKTVGKMIVDIENKRCEELEIFSYLVYLSRSRPDKRYSDKYPELKTLVRIVSEFISYKLDEENKCYVPILAPNPIVYFPSVNRGICDGHWILADPPRINAYEELKNRSQNTTSLFKKRNDEMKLKYQKQVAENVALLKD